MADDRRSEDGVRTWRVTGWRRWLFVLLLVLFLVQAAGRAVVLLTEPPSGLVDQVLLVVFLIGALCYGALVVQLWRAEVTLGPTGIEVRAVRRRRIPYADVSRAYRNRFTPAPSRSTCWTPRRSCSPHPSQA